MTNDYGRWEGIETEIYKVITMVDGLNQQIVNSGKDKILIHEQDERILNYFLQGYSTEAYGGGHIITSESIQIIKQALLDDLYGMIRQLEIYLAKEVNNTLVAEEMALVNDINPDKIISFNYTNTYSRVYDDSKEICYIHGEAFLDHDLRDDEIKNYMDTQEVSEEKAKILLSARKNNMVVGIDEYLDEDRQQNDNLFIQFKKFYQRIIKKTGASYEQWIHCDNSHTSGLRIFFIGHSLDLRDKDIIKELVTADGADVVIYYHSESSLENYVQNLVKIIGEQEVIRRVSGNSASIHFMPQE